MVQLISQITILGCGLAESPDWCEQEFPRTLRLVNDGFLQDFSRISTINRRLKMECLIANKKRYGSKALCPLHNCGKNLVEWVHLPDDWITKTPVLVGIGLPVLRDGTASKLRVPSQKACVKHFPG